LGKATIAETSELSTSKNLIRSPYFMPIHDVYEFDVKLYSHKN
jgi:hypothetical protein